MSYVAGIDLGSRHIKAVFLENQILRYTYKCKTEIMGAQLLAQLLSIAKTESGFPTEQLSAVYATGYGRNSLDADKTISEILCHAKGVRHYYPEVRTIVDIGGQDAKCLILDTTGKVTDFVMNDKCAAGTGRFMEMTAERLNCSCEHLSALAAQSTRDVTLNHTCVVFAETEIVNLLTQAATSADIARAVHLSIARRIGSQLNLLAWQAPVCFTGGVAANADLRHYLETILNTAILIPPNHFYTGALGAALYAAESLEGK